MMLRHTDRDCRSNQRAGPLADPRAMTSAQIASVPIRPFGPCCSFEPIGMMIPRLF
jgi:hypothetical protein